MRHTIIELFLNLAILGFIIWDFRKIQRLRTDNKALEEHNGWLRDQVRHLLHQFEGETQAELRRIGLEIGRLKKAAVRR